MKSPRKTKLQIQPWTCEGLQISVRGDTFHCAGTLRVGKRSERVRETLGVPATKDNKSNAEREARRVAGRVRAELGGGVVRKSVATLVAERFHSHIGPTDRLILKHFTAEFTTRILHDVPSEEIVAFVKKYHGRDKDKTPTAESRERFISGICSFLNRQIAEGQYPELPNFKRNAAARNPSRRATRPVQRFRIELLEEIIKAAHPTVAIQLRVEYVGGARVSSVLQGAVLEDLDMGKKMVLTFRNTKNDDDVPVALPESIRQPMSEYLDWRMQQVRKGLIGPGGDQPLFLHYKGRAYQPNGGAWGTQNKAAFNGAKRRAIKAVGERYDAAIELARAARNQRQVDRLMRAKDDDLALLRRFTQHWLRHLFATDIGRQDPISAMRQGGWRDSRSLHGYMIKDAEYQRGLVEARGLPDTKLTQAPFRKRAK